MLDEKLMRQLVCKGANVWDLMIRFGRSKSSIVRDMKRFGIEIVDGFFKVPGSKVGRPKGIPMSEEQKQFMSERFKGKGNPFSGKHHSAQTRHKMSRNHANFKGDKNPFKRSLQDPEKLRQHKERCQRKWDGRDEVWRRAFGQKLSKAISESQHFRDGKFHRHHASGFLSTKKAGRIFYRSSWERLFALYLDQHNSVRAFALEPFCVPYMDEAGVERRSRIDFHIVFQNGSEAVVEVKPKALQVLPRNAAKIAGYRQFCDSHNIQFGVVDEDSIHDQMMLDDISQSLSSPATSTS